MKLSLSRLFSQQGSTINANIPVTVNPGESLAGFQVSAYIKSSFSSANVLCVMDATLDVMNKAINVSVPHTKASSIPAGQLIYYVELSKGISSKVVERNYLNIEP